jgi:(S)-3,5-dihydroxyphenylglycine transaminase
MLRTYSSTLGEYERLARERVDPDAWTFVLGGEAADQTMLADVQAFGRIRLRPRVPTLTARPNTAVEIFDMLWAAPLAVAPTPNHTLFHPEGEVATVKAAGSAGIPVVISMFAGRTFEELNEVASAPIWLQVLCFGDRSATYRLVDRAERAGCQALVLSVSSGPRSLGEVREELRLAERAVPVNLEPGHADLGFDLNWTVLEQLRGMTSLPILLRGVHTPADARRAVDAGADGVVVSGPGGGYLDVLPEIAETVNCPIILDSGVRHGEHILAALALGAHAVLLGSPVLHGLSVGEADGVAGVLDIVVAQLMDAMTLTRTPTVGDISSDLLVVDRPQRPADLRKADLHASVSDEVMDTMTVLNEVTARFPETISFAPGRPYDGFVDVEQISAHVRRYLGHLEQQSRTPGQIRDTMFQYGPSAGLIRELIAESLRVHEEVDVPPESIVVTIDGQEAMFLALRAVVREQDVLLVSSPCSMGITGAARMLDLTVRTIAERPEGLDCAAVEAVLLAEKARGRSVRALYVVPDHAHPAGTTMPLATRYELLDLAARHDILLFEDSPYRLVGLGFRMPTLKALDRDRRVIHLGSFATTVFPGARVGYAVADQIVVDDNGRTGLLADELAKLKSMITVNPSTLGQVVVAGALLEAEGKLPESEAFHDGAMRSTLDQLALRFPAERRNRLGVRWNEPSGGFFLTLTVPFRADNDALQRSARDFGVIWTPMSHFYPEGGGEYAIRLSMSYLSVAEIEEGTARLARFVESEIARNDDRTGSRTWERPD